MKEEKKVSSPADESSASKPGQIVYDENGGRFIAYMLIGFGLLLALALWIGT